MQQVHKAQQTSTLTRSREIMANWLAGHVCYRPKNASEEANGSISQTYVFLSMRQEYDDQYCH
jgi:hypothetical protein